MVAETGARQKELRAKKEKTFSPVMPSVSEQSSEKTIEQQSENSNQNEITESPSDTKQPTYGEVIQDYVKKRQEWEEKRKKKAEERKARKEEEKKKRMEHMKITTECKKEFYQTLEAIKNETQTWRIREEEKMTTLKRLSEKIKNGLPREDIKPARLEIISLKEELSELQRHYLARVLILKAKKAELKARLKELKTNKPCSPEVQTGYIAALVVMDDRSRYTYTLKILSTATAEEVVAILKQVLPPTVQYIISDNGTQFTAEDFKEFCDGDAKIIHVRIYPHHPRENGRAERLIRTVKDYLELYDWNNAEELAIVLEKIAWELNNTPHQAIGYSTPAMFHSGGEKCKASS